MVLWAGVEGRVCITACLCVDMFTVFVGEEGRARGKKSGPILVQPNSAAIDWVCLHWAKWVPRSLLDKVHRQGCWSEDAVCVCLFLSLLGSLTHLWFPLIS